jgi:serine/threonine protein kinase
MTSQRNVLVDETGHPLIMSLGSTSVVDEGNSAEDDRGGPDSTEQWAAPEILNGGAYTEQGDVFSFAMLAIEVRRG